MYTVGMQTSTVIVSSTIPAVVWLSVCHALVHVAAVWAVHVHVPVTSVTVCIVWAA